MRYVWQIVFALIAVTGCRQKEPDIVDGSLEWRPVMLEFGEVREGDRVEGTVEFVNETGQTVRFEEIVRSCGCTNAFVEPEEMQPGARAYLKVTLEPSMTRSSSVVRLLTDSRRREINVPILWSCVGDLRATPQALNFGNVSVGEQHEEVVVLVGDEETKWEELSVHAFPDGELTAAITGDQCIVALYPKKAGTTRGIIRVKGPGSASVSPEILEIPVVWHAYERTAGGIRVIASCHDDVFENGDATVKALFLSPEPVDFTHWMIVDPQNVNMNARFVKRNSKSFWSSFTCRLEDADATYTLMSGNRKAILEFKAKE